jgi:hypothetical protein
MNALLAILSAVVNSLWQALVVAVLVWLVLRFVPRINAATRYAIWWATLGVVLILPVAPRLIQTLRAHPKPAAVTTVKTPTVKAPAAPVEPVVVTVPPGRTAIWPIAVLTVWAAILLWRLFQIVRSYFYLRGVKRRAAVSPIPLPAIPRHADLLISPDTSCCTNPLTLPNTTTGATSPCVSWPARWRCIRWRSGFCGGSSASGKWPVTTGSWLEPVPPGPMRQAWRIFSNCAGRGVARYSRRDSSAADRG